MLLRARQFEFAFPRPALLMGVVNATPDSFYDSGRRSNTEAAVAHALQLAAEGADIIDVGGESSRPRANPVTQAEELRRVIPVLEALAGAVSIPLSINTVKPEVAREALRAGASIINDIAANRDDGEMSATWPPEAAPPTSSSTCRAPRRQCRRTPLMTTWFPR